MANFEQETINSNKYIDKENEQVDYDKDIWKLIDVYFRDVGNAWTQHQIESTDEFFSESIKEIIQDNNPIIINGDLDQDTNKFNIEYRLEFLEPYIGQPIIQENNGATKLLTPNEARMRNSTYSVAVYADIEQSVRYRKDNGEWDEPDKELVPRVMLGKIPIMLGSKFCVLSQKSTDTRMELGECKYDQLGYFIINGNEKVLVSQEKMKENNPNVHHYRGSKYSDCCEIRSVIDGRYNMTKTTTVKMMAKDNVGTGRTIRINIQGIKHDIPLFLIFRALGVSSDKEIIKMITYNLEDNAMISLIKPSFEEGTAAYSQEEALEEISKNINLTVLSSNITPEEKQVAKTKYLKDVLVNYLLPHVGNSYEKKAYYLGYMTNRLLSCILGRRPYDDRDHFANKKVETAGVLLSYLFALNFRQKLIKQFRKEILKDMSNLREGIKNIKLDKYIKPTIIDTGLKYSFATGTWNLKNSPSSTKVGVSQVLTRHNYKSALSHTRRVNTPMDKSQKKLVGPHNLHSTQWGTICPSETPDGEQIGISKNLAIMSQITNFINPDPVIEILLELGMKYIDEVGVNNISNGTKIFVNGNWIGMHYEPNVLVDILKKYRRNGIIHIHTSIAWRIFYSEIIISTDAGRCVRPLLIVENNKLRLTNKILDDIKNNKIKWRHLLGIQSEDGNDSNDDTAIIEYIDSTESETIMCAINPQDLKNNNEDNQFYMNYTHCELHPSMIMGIVISDQPFCNHNQSPRVIYYGNMGKQGIGIYATNFNNRIDTLGHILHYPQKPLVSTRASRLIPGRDLPSGQMAIVAIACYSGFNQEDSVIANAGAIDRGLFVSTYFRKYSDEEKKNHAELQEEKFTKPGTKNVINPKDNYDTIDENGFAIKGKFVKGGDVIIGKVIPLKVSSKDGSIQKHKDASVTMKPNETGYVDKISWNINGDGYKYCKVKIRTDRIPQIGDKVASRASQKGTIGMIFPQEDMPFNKDGIVPDIIINPHAIPSRMTIGQLMECIMGKCCAIKGFEGDATPFNGIQTRDIAKLLGTPVEQGGCGMTEYISPDNEYEGYGNEVLYNGMTGDQLDFKIFMGPTYYHRLKHMVDDKMHSRSKGPYQMLTKQPSEGRSREGGLRIGEMERDCMIAHGSAQFLKERMLDVSDLYKIYVDKESGLFSIGTPENGTLKEGSNVKALHIPYAFKLLHQELMAIGIAVRLRTN